MRRPQADERAARDRQAAGAPEPASEEDRLVEAALAQASDVEWHGNENGVRREGIALGEQMP